MSIKEAKERIDKLAEERKARIRKDAPLPQPLNPVEDEPTKPLPAK